MASHASPNVAERLLAGLRGERPAVVVGERATSAEALRARILGLAAHFAKMGVQPGERALVLVPPGGDLPAAVLALVWIGAVPVLLEPEQAPGAWAARVARAAPAWVVVDPRLPWIWGVPGLLPLLRRLRPVPGRPAEGRLLPLPARAAGEPPALARAPDDPALVLFTSGTTSAPRAVVHTHGNLQAFLDGVDRVAEGLPMESYLAETPQQIFYALLRRSTCHLVLGQGEARLKRTLALLASGRVEAWFGSPWTWVRWLDEGRPVPPGLRAVMLGSAPVTRPFLRRLLAALPEQTVVRCLYGLTELGPACLVDAATKRDWAGEGDLVGPPLPGVSVDIRGGGDIWLASPALAASYLGEGPVGPWLDTGDLGALGPAGLVLHGRRKDMILRRGVNLYPGVLEPLLLTHVTEAALVGVYDAAREDERVVLAYVGPEGFDAAPLLGDAAPDHTLRLDALPRAGRQHKVDRVALRELARARFHIPG